MKQKSMRICISTIKLSFVPHILDTVNRCMRNLGFVTRSSVHLSPYCFKLLYCSLIRSLLKYASVIWSPYYLCHIEHTRAVQKTFLRSLAYRADINIF